jgi:serine/threonine-protein kinase
VTASVPDPARVRELFDAAVEQAPERREAYLAEACGQDPALRREVMSLLACVSAPTLGAPALPSRTHDLPREIGRFAVLGKVGEGGMGVVLRGRDPTLDRDVALKLVNHLGGDGGQRRLLREAQAMARVAHPNVVPVYEVGVHGRQVFVAMELVRGTTMRAWLRAQPRTWRAILQVVIDAARGLAAAHRAGVLHRDVKPDNLLIGDDGRARVADFGLADLAVELAADGAVVGTPGFMSPEHFIGTVTPLADQWSLAATTYSALFGSPPFLGTSIGELRDAVLDGPPPRPPPSEVPPAAIDAVLRGMARHPEDRFATLDDYADALAEVLAVDPAHDRRRFRRQRRGLAIAIAIAGVASFLFRGVYSGFRFDGGVAAHRTQAVIGLTIMGGVTFVFRRALLGTTHDRRVMSLVLTSLIAIAAHRIIAGDADAVTLLRTDAVFSSAMLFLGAVTIEPWLAISAGLMVPFLIASLFVPAIAAPAFGPVLVSTLALGIWFWRDT